MIQHSSSWITFIIIVEKCRMNTHYCRMTEAEPVQTEHLKPKRPLWSVIGITCQVKIYINIYIFSRLISRSKHKASCDDGIQLINHHIPTGNHIWNLNTAIKPQTSRGKARGSWLVVHKLTKTHLRAVSDELPLMGMRSNQSYSLYYSANCQASGPWLLSRWAGIKAIVVTAIFLFNLTVSVTHLLSIVKQTITSIGNSQPLPRCNKLPPADGSISPPRSVTGEPGGTAPSQFSASFGGGGREIWPYLPVSLRRNDDCSVGMILLSLSADKYEQIRACGATEPMPWLTAWGC